MPAKPNNTNALKHGLYAKRYSPDEIKALRKMPFDDLRQEITFLRVRLDRLTVLLDAATDDDTKIKYINAATNAALAIGTLVTRYTIQTGVFSPLDDALQEALANVPAYEPE